MSEYHTTLPENIRQLLNLPGSKISLSFIEDFTDEKVSPSLERFVTIYLAFTDTKLKKKNGKSVNAAKPRKFEKWYKEQNLTNTAEAPKKIIKALKQYQILLPVPSSHKLHLNIDALVIIYHEIKFAIALSRIKNHIGTITCGKPIEEKQFKKICDAYITKQEFINMGLIGRSEEFYLR